MFSSKLALCLLLAIGAEALRHGSVRMALVPQSHQQSLVSSTQKVLRTFQVAGVMLSAAALKPLAASASAPTSASAASAGSAGSAGSVASVASVGSVDFQAVRDEIGKLYTADPNKGPTLVRLAWHSSGTYDKMSRTGGSQGGTVRFTQELAHGANAGLQQAVHWLEPVYATYKKQGLSHADLYTLAGVEAIRLMGGPSIGENGKLRVSEIL
ncbi:heme peroxidase [Ochromonadaceae sp. CCMP2298]|nr:heme peroxidase [Ochromonadaceae sp. CCMP2298]